MPTYSLYLLVIPNHDYLSWKSKLLASSPNILLSHRGADDRASYVNLLKELRLAFEGEAKTSGEPRLLLTAAVPASFEAIAAGYDVPEISKYLDFINVMTYDFHGQWERQVGHNSPLKPLEGK